MKKREYAYGTHSTCELRLLSDGIFNPGDTANQNQCHCKLHSSGLKQTNDLKPANTNPKK
jgi:hypothetical protein